jgi:hypothetical protein
MAICDKKYFGFNIVDFTLFSNLAYEDEPYFTHDLHTWFPCKNCRIEKKFNQSVTFFDYYIPEKNLSIISVRGTHVLIDILQDLDIWKEIALLQVASLFGPIVNFWPTPLTKSIVFYVSYFEQLLMTSRSRFFSFFIIGILSIIRFWMIM